MNISYLVGVVLQLAHAALERLMLHLHKLLVGHSRTDAEEPRALVTSPWNREGGSRELLRVQAIWALEQARYTVTNAYLQRRSSAAHTLLIVHVAGCSVLSGERLPKPPSRSCCRIRSGTPTHPSSPFPWRHRSPPCACASQRTETC